jgi:hypothetical protein
MLTQWKDQLNNHITDKISSNMIDLLILSILFIHLFTQQVIIETLVGKIYNQKI